MTAVRAIAARVPRRPRGSRARSAVAVTRLSQLIETLTGRAPTVSGLDELIDLAAEALRTRGPEEIWLTLAVVTAQLPESSEVVRLRRKAELDGTGAVVSAVIDQMPSDRLDVRVEIATDEVLVDVNHLAQTTLLTGIQRVTHETVRRWHRDHAIALLRWTDDFLAVQRTSTAETTRVTSGPGAAPRNGSPRQPSKNCVVVPWRSAFVLPEVALEVPRTKRLQALALYSRCSTAVIGFDTVPLTSGETADTNVPAYFMHELAAIRHMDRVAAISGAAATEYRGWRTMISSLGVEGPQIEAIMLPSEGREPSPASLTATRDHYVIPGLPLVLCVGSHEPRKNHLAVLHAAELLWRRGVQFTLVFVGGNSWHSERFQGRLSQLQDAGRTVESALGIADETLWALYRLARCTVFPSLNEGYGLPVAESLASGTPVVTSDFGSMLEIGAPGGALLVDPRDDHAIAGAMETLLTDDLEHDRLVREARLRSTRTWDDYARETWEYLVTGAAAQDPQNERD